LVARELNKPTAKSMTCVWMRRVHGAKCRMLCVHCELQKRRTVRLNRVSQHIPRRYAFFCAHSHTCREMVATHAPLKFIHSTITLGEMKLPFAHTWPQAVGLLCLLQSRLKNKPHTPLFCGVLYQTSYNLCVFHLDHFCSIFCSSLMYSVLIENHQ